ncbi:hypothetical protein OHC33_004955 [Knufia fluminis]|uniref:Uncharacterized protein n=1 Tax=Knufia fluminis TaxID=191047 RepID=A0AAN8EU13_9EURO|nr:hypothetical protein OHC33_004955 [Knufia fluminis]
MQGDRPDRPGRTSGTHSINARLESLRSILTNSERHTTQQQELALQAIDSERRDRESQEQEGRRPQNSSHARSMNEEGLFEPQTSASAASIVQARRSLPAGRERLARQRHRMERLARQDPFDHASNATPLAGSLSTTRARSPSAEADMEPHSIRDGGRSKRRKLDDGSSEDRTLPIYGLEGTLLPGNLKMKVLDYPRPEDPLPPADELARSRLYQADNKDVFRTKKHKCTILMKHQGGWPFSLSKLVIKLPKHDPRDDTSPLQGMVFISMDQDKLLERTTCYDSLFPAGYHSHRVRRYGSYGPSHDYMHSTRSPMRSFRNRQPPDPADSQWREPSRTRDEPFHLPSTTGISTTIERLPPDPEISTAPSPRSPRPWHDPDYDRDYPPRRTMYTDSYRPSYTSTSTSTLTPHQAAERARRWRAAAASASAEAEYLQQEGDPTISESPSPSHSDSDEDQDQDEQDEQDEAPPYRDVPSAQRELEEAEYRQRSFLEQSRVRRESGRGERSDAYSYANLARYAERNSEDPLHDSDEYERRRHSPYPHPQPHPHVSTKRLPGCNEMLRGRRADSDTEADDTEGPLAPHATFQVPSGAAGGGGVAVNFEPEVSGKYILVKLWTQCPNSCVAVQGVVPYGFAGLRQVADLGFR